MKSAKLADYPNQLYAFGSVRFGSTHFAFGSIRFDLLFRNLDSVRFGSAESNRTEPKYSTIRFGLWNLQRCSGSYMIIFRSARLARNPKDSFIGSKFGHKSIILECTVSDQILYDAIFCTFDMRFLTHVRYELQGKMQGWK